MFDVFDKWLVAELGVLFVIDVVGEGIMVGGMFWLKGSSGMGKSAWSAKLLDLYKGCGTVVVHHFCKYNDVEKSDLWCMLYSLLV